jgi:hypothetical protein
MGHQLRASETAVTEQHEEESLRRASREQAEIERQTDALVLRTLTAMVTAAEDLKSKLRRDTEDILENYRRSKRGLENDISLAGAERQRLRREAEDERDGLLERARETADQIVTDAERERETLLAEVRTMEQRLRGLDAQIRSALGLGDEMPARAAAPAPDQASSPAPEPEPEPTSSFVPVFSPPVVELPTEPEPAPTSAAAPTPYGGDEAVAEAEPATPAVGTSDGPMSEAELQAALAAVLDPPTEKTTAPPAPTPAPALAETPRPSPPPVAPAPAPAAEPAPPPAPTPAPPPRPAPAQPRPVRLVFDGVPGYQQAAALEQAVSDLVPDEEVEIEEFEQGQLVLTVTVSNLSALAEQLVAASPASIVLDSANGDRATFRYT